ncbi:MAG: DUF3570 domain-containing protein [Myxococcales bacterium]|nr:DUF3570 domain-containing protein [Myxococcales bacterium]
MNCGLVLASALGCAVLAMATPANAAGASDGDVRQLIDLIYSGEYAQGKFKEALEKVEIGKIFCEGELCTKKVRAQLFLAIGTIHARLGDAAQAKIAFASALKDDPASLPRGEHSNEVVLALFEEVKGGARPVLPEGCRASFGGNAAPRGWSSAEAQHCHAEAVLHEKSGEFSRCEADARAALELEEQAVARATLARCLEASNNWLEAASEWEETARQAPRTRNFTLARHAQSRAAQLRRRTPVIVIEIPKDTTDLTLQLDGVALPIEMLGQEIPANPGEHTVIANSKRGNLPLRFKRTVVLEPSVTLPIAIELTPFSPEVRCVLEAQTADALSKCLRQASPTGNLDIRVGTELSGYTDTMDVDVLTPSVFTTIEHATDGWGVNAAFLVDVVTAASADILATASPRWREVRYVPALGAHARFGDVDVALNTSLSQEPDYLSVSGGGKVAVELRQKTVTPSLGLDYARDTSGRRYTPYSVFSHTIERIGINAGVGLVLTKATFGSLNFTALIEDGDTSKPYRYVPLFSPEVAPLVPAGLEIDSVNLFRLPERPLEQVPTHRERLAMSFSAAHRFASSTLRASERLYLDTWGVKASTTDGRYIVDVVKGLRLWPHARFHVQTGASFWERAYVAPASAEGIAIPAVRTGDRELGPMLAATVGGGARYDFGAHSQYGASFTGDFVYSRFLDHLYVKSRLGYFGALTFEAEFE